MKTLHGVYSKFIIFLYLLFNAQLIISQTFTAFINHLNDLQDSTSKWQTIDSFIEATEVFPYIDGNYCTFIYYGSAQMVHVTGNQNLWSSPGDIMTRVGNTDLWYKTVWFEEDARIEYRFSIDQSNIIPDPLNPRIVDYGNGPTSVLAMPLYIWPWENKVYTNVPQGRLDSFQIHSKITGYNYPISVYLPFGYDPDIEYPSVYFNDGNAFGVVPQIYDNLIDSQLVESFIGVFIRPQYRDQEYFGALRHNHRIFLATELVPLIDTLYSTRDDPAERAIVGLSASGNLSPQVAYYHNELFELVGLQIPGIWFNNDETHHLFQNGEKKEIRWIAVTGTYDYPDLNSSLKEFFQMLQGKGYEVVQKEYHEGHSLGLAASTLDDILIYLLPGTLTKTSVPMPLEEELDIMVFPNPANDHITISFRQPQGVQYIHFYDFSGRVIQSLKYTEMGRRFDNKTFYVDHLVPGSYSILVGGDCWNQMLKFIKIN